MRIFRLASTSNVVERRQSRVHCRLSQLLFNPQQLVVLGHSVTPARCAGLDLPGIESDHQVGYGDVLGLAAAVGDDRCPPGSLSHGHGSNGLGQRAYLVNLA